MALVIVLSVEGEETLKSLAAEDQFDPIQLLENLIKKEDAGRHLVWSRKEKQLGKA